MRVKSTSDTPVHGYRFMLRRIEGALIQRDPQMRTDALTRHRRAMFAGVGIAVLGLTAGLVIGLFRPSPVLPGEGIVISKQTGAVYLIAENTLTPTFNLASARLLLARKELEGNEAKSRGGKAAEPKVVDEAAFRTAKLKTGRRTGIPDAPGLLPAKDQRLDISHSGWGVCEVEGRTTVLAGLDPRKPELGIALGDDEVLLVRGPDEQDQLLYRNEGKVVRARMAKDSKALRAAWNITGQKPKRVGSALINLVPEVPELAVPRPNDLFRTQDVNGRHRFWVVESGDTHQVSEAVAKLIWQKRTDTLPPRPPQSTTDAKGDWETTKHYPGLPPRPLTDADKLCVSWTNRGANLFTGTAPALGVTINATGPTGEKIDDFVLPAGRAAVVTSGKYGPIMLVTDHGITYGVPSLLTAQVLGIAEPDDPFQEHKILEGPEALLRLLPAGPQLDITKAVCTYDTVSPGPSADATPVALPAAARVIASPPRGGWRRGPAAAPRC